MTDNLASHQKSGEFLRAIIGLQPDPKAVEALADNTREDAMYLMFVHGIKRALDLYVKIILGESEVAASPQTMCHGMQCKGQEHRRAEWHECPYKVEIKNDHSKCDCCERCQKLCADEV